MPIPSGIQVVPAKPLELHRILGQLSASDLDQLDPLLGDWMRRFLGRQALAALVLPTSGSVFVGLRSLEPAGFIFVERNHQIAHLRAWAVAPDMRRRGIASAMLSYVERYARNRGVQWMYMRIQSGNTPAVQTALGAGFRRYLPQYLRRESSALLNVGAGDAYVVSAPDAVLQAWHQHEVSQGDAWAAELITDTLLPYVLPDPGLTYRCMLNDREVGAVRVSILRAGDHEADLLPVDVALLGRAAPQHVSLWFWCDPSIWNTPLEFNCIRAALNTLQHTPNLIDLHIGSFDHLKASLPQWKALGFKPQITPRWLMLKSLIPK
ncbi:MAG: GNAT family N-acetyltransferase [Anaerolineae bacterium]|nr:GNAT family N-acetyltransferase [Anaerolineae bacterium]